MRNLRTICVVIVGCLVAGPGAWAATKSPPPAAMLWANKTKPFATVVMPKTPLNFGEVANSGGKKLTAKITPTVVANHPYRLAVSFAGLTLGASAVQIPANQLTVKINGMVVPLGTARVEIKSGSATSPKGVTVPITIEVSMQEAVACRAGHYGGSMTLYIK
jgi:hypothetical protein